MASSPETFLTSNSPAPAASTHPCAEDRLPDLELILDSIPDALIYTNLRREILRVNPAFTQLFGYSEDEILGRSTRELYGAASDFTSLENDVRAAVLDPGSIRIGKYDFRYRTSDGRTVLCEVRARVVTGRNGEAQGILSILRDITEKHEASRAIAESEAMLRLVTDHLPSRIGYVDSDLRYRFVNKAYEEAFGLPRGQIIGSRIDDVLGAETFAKILPYLMEVFAGNAATYELTMPIPAGEQRLQVLYVPDFHPQGAVRGCFVLSTDISAIKRAQEELESLAQELKRTVAAREEFVSIASHELRSPLTALGAHLEMLSMEAEEGSPAPVSSPEIRGRLKVANRQIDRLGSLISNLLDVSRMRHGKFELDPGTMDLNALLEEVAQRVLPEFQEKGISLSITPSARPILGQWDRLRLDQVMMNLLSNAIRHGQGRPVEIRAGTEANEAWFSVRDEGKGIPEQEQERLFLAFEQAQDSRKSGGLGLGLFLVRQIVEAHRGVIRLQSASGQGATFTVRLPLAPAHS